MKFSTRWFWGSFSIGLICLIGFWMKDESMRTDHSRALSACKDASLNYQVQNKTGFTPYACDISDLVPKFYSNSQLTEVEQRVFNTRDEDWTAIGYSMFSMAFVVGLIPFIWSFFLRRVSDISKAIRGQL